MLDRLEQKDWALARELRQALRRARPARHRRAGGVRRRRPRQGLVAGRQSSRSRASASFGDDLRRAGEPDASCRSCCSAPRRRSRSTCRGWCRGEMVGAYCLSESGSGSDALGAKTRATRQPDGSFVLNGEKMWITNGGFADLFIVFAKVDGEHFTAFIVERAFAGVRAARKSTRWACTARRRRRSSCRTCRCRPRTCSARSARATRSRSTC